MGMLVLAGGLISSPALAQGDGASLASYLSRNFVCGRHASAADRKAADCENIERDKAALLRQYRDQPDFLNAINHPETVKRVGFSGVDNIPEPKVK